MENIAVYVPFADRWGIIEGSGIVGSWEEVNEAGDRLVIDYEGNRYGAANMKTYADRVYHAWGRHSVRYPTASRLWVEPESMIKVGEYWPAEGQVFPLLAKLRILQTWLSVDEIDPAEFKRTE